MTDARKQLDKSISEQELQDCVVELARRTGWRVMHARPAMNRRGEWSTPIQGDPGYLDLTMVRGGRIIFAELKTERGKTSPSQDEWLRVLRATGRAEVYLWRPSDWSSGEIERALR